MRLMNFIIWLCVGAVLGWFARVMVEVEYMRPLKPMPDEEPSSDTS